MVKKLRPARRIFGRPKEAPGPQEVFEGEFQLTQGQAPAPSHQRLFRPPPTRSGSSASTAGSVRVVSRPMQNHQRGASSSSNGSGSGHSGGSVATTNSREDHVAAERSGVDMPARQRRTEDGRHLATHSSAVVPTVQAASGNFSRSRAHNVLSSDNLSGLYISEEGLSSAAAVQFHSPLTTAASPHETRQLPSRTSSRLNPPNGSTSPASNLSSGRVGTADFRGRHASHAMPDMSPAYTSSSLYPSPLLVPVTPSSIGGASIPSSAYPDLSPLLNFSFGTLSPELTAADGDVEEQPPLTPDAAVIDSFPSPIRLRPRSNSSPYVSGSSYGALAMSSLANQSSTSVPELDGLTWPSELFYSDLPEFTPPETSGIGSTWIAVALTDPLLLEAPSTSDSVPGGLPGF